MEIVKKVVKTITALVPAVNCVVGSYSTEAYAFNNILGTVKWSDGTKMYLTIYVGVVNSFNVQSGIYFTGAGSKKQHR